MKSLILAMVLLATGCSDTIIGYQIDKANKLCEANRGIYKFVAFEPSQ